MINDISQCVATWFRFGGTFYH